MKQNHIVTGCMALALTLLCCACTPAKETPEQIAEKMQTALSETPVGQAQMVMNIDMSMDAGEYGTMDMSTVSTTVITICQDPASSYASTTAEVSFAGETSQTTAETYTLSEDGALVSYVNSDGIWMKLSTGQTIDDLTASAASVAVDSTNVAVDETDTEWQGKEAICLTTQIKGDALQDILDGMISSLTGGDSTLDGTADLIGAADYSALTCDARIYLDAETYLPLTEEMTFTGMSEVLDSIFGQMGISAEVTNCTASYTFLSYEPQDEIKLPDGAAESAEAWTRLLAGEPDNDDGTYTIREGMVLIDIVPPAGFELSEKDYDHVYFTRDDQRTVKYTIYYLTGADTAGSDFTAMVSSNASRYEQNGGQVEREQLTLDGDSLDFYCDLLGLTWESGREEAEFYAWSPLADDGSAIYFLLVEVGDGYNDGMGSSKSADITYEEFVSYLNAAASSSLIG